jgi:hypothetical protein
MNFVQGTFEFAGSGAVSSASKAYASNNVLGDTLIIDITWSDTSFADVTSVTDSQGNTWVRAPVGTVTANLQNVSQWYMIGCKAGANTVTAHWAAATAFSVQINIREYSGIASFDKSATASGNGVTSSVSFTPTAGGEGGVGATWAANGGSFNAPYTGRVATAQLFFSGDDLSLPSGAQTMQCTVNECCCAPQNWLSAVMLFVPSASSAPQDPIGFGAEA